MNPYNMTMDDPQGNMMTISAWSGVNKLVTPSEIKENEMSDAQNIQLSEAGFPDKRWGYQRIFDHSLGATKINGAYEALFGGYIIFAWGTGLYKQSGTADPVSIYNSLTNNAGHFFSMGLNLYYKNGAEYVQIDPSFNVVTVQSIAFIPTTSIAKPPAGGGTAFEAVNLLQPARKNSFVGNGSAVAFQLDTTSLDATTVTAVVAGTTITEGAGLTVNRTTGIVTFSVAPVDGSGVDNVIITFYKTISGYANKILTSTVKPVSFGGDNDTRIFTALENIRYYSGLYDATYFPDINYSEVGLKSANITAFSQLGDTQIILKEHKETEPTIWSSRFELTSGVVSFPIFPINGVGSCDAPNSSQIVKNNPIFLDRADGIYWLTVSNVRDQRIVDRLSDRINKDLLAEANITNATSFIWDYRYGVCVNGNVYVWDFRLDAWYGKWTNINASCFFEIAGTLYFGDSAKGLIYKFDDKYNDDGVAISCWFTTKFIAFGNYFRKKLLSRLYVDLKASPKCSVIPSYMTDKTPAPKYLRTIFRSLFTYEYIDYSLWTYSASFGFPKAFLRKMREKNLVWVQFKFENSTLDESMPILSTQYEYTLESLTKDN